MYTCVSPASAPKLLCSVCTVSAGTSTTRLPLDARSIYVYAPDCQDERDKIRYVREPTHPPLVCSSTQSNGMVTSSLLFFRAFVIFPSSGNKTIIIFYNKNLYPDNMRARIASSLKKVHNEGK